MSRDDWIWLAIRGTGLYFAIQAIIAIPETVAGVGTWLGFSIAFSSGIETDLSKLAGPMAIAAAAGRAFSAPTALVVYSVAAWYFLRGAPVIARMLKRDS